MNILRRFLHRSYKNTHATRTLDLSTRLRRVIMWDREIEGGLSQLAPYVKYGKYWYNCVKSPERLWWI